MHVTAKASSAGDEEFLAGYEAGQFERPSVAVDVVVVTVAGGGLHCLLVRRAEPPQEGSWALPGGFVGFKEGLDEAAGRVLAVKGGVHHAYLEQLYTFGDPGRDPRTRVITVAYVALVDSARLSDVPGEQPGGVVVASLDVPWRGERGGPVTARAAGEELTLAFDHAEILGLSVKRLRGKLGYAPVGYELLPPNFTLRQLQDIHEAILGRALNKDSFRRRMLAGGQLRPTGRREAGVAYRPAELYRFVKTTPTTGRKRKTDG
jgi:8-oxo-dGTP diphosphatase